MMNRRSHHADPRAKLAPSSLDPNYQPSFIPSAATLGRGLLLIHLVLSPLVFVRDTVEVFEFNKITLLLLTAIVLGALGLSSLIGQIVGRPAGTRFFTTIHSPVRSLCRDPIALGFLLLLASAVASTVFSLSPRTSLRGTQESFAGLWTVLAYTVLFFATRTLCRNPDDGRRLLAGSVIGAAVASTYALQQVAGADLIAWDNVSRIGAYVRPLATLGNPNFLAAFLAMTFPLSAYFALRAAQRRCWLPLLVFAAVSVLSCTVIVACLSRGAWLAFGCGLAVVVLGWLWQAEQRRFLIPGLGILLASGGLVLLGMFFWSDHTFVSSVRERVQHLGESSSRKHVWRAGLRIFAEHPFLGCGLDTFQLAFEQHRTTAYWQTEWNVTPTKAHNEAIHILATQGLFGAAAILVVIAGLFRAALRAWRRDLMEKPLLAAVLAAVVGFCIQDLFSFTVAGCGTLFVTLAALLSCWGRGYREAPPCLSPGRFRAFAVGLVSAEILAIVVFFYNVFQGPVHFDSDILLGCFAILAAFGVVTSGLFHLESTERSVFSERVGYQREASPRRHNLRVPLWVRGLQGCIAASAVLLLIKGVVLPWQANRICCLAERMLEVDVQQALTKLERAVQLDSAQELYWVKLGTAAEAAARNAPTAAERQGLLQRAQRAYEQAHALVPVNSYNHANLGRILGKLAGEGLASAADAFAEFDEALAVDRNNAYFYAAAGEAALVVGDGARVRSYCSSGLELYPRFGPLRAQLGYLALLEDRPEDAARSLSEALGCDWYGDEDGFVTALLVQTRLFLRLQRAEEALHAARCLVERLDDSADARLLLAQAFLLAGRRDEAAAEYHRLRLSGAAH